MEASSRRDRPSRVTRDKTSSSVPLNNVDTSSRSHPNEDQNLDGSSSSPSLTSPPESPMEINSSASSSEAAASVSQHASSRPQRGKPKRLSKSKEGSPEPREKRKRSRVTQDQLVTLEQIFAMNPSPTATRRKEISEMLGMQERQTQIWFQNRRAKAKLQEGKNKGRGHLAVEEAPPDTPPDLCTGYDLNLQNLLHETEAVTIIPCTDLLIGTFRRMASTVGRYDLVTYICDGRRCLTWFIHSNRQSFKMEISFDTILETRFTNCAPGRGLASFVLSRPPQFFMERTATPGPEGEGHFSGWERCGDWSQDLQATRILRHDLVGSAVQLAHVLRNFNAGAAGAEISLHPPSYRRSHGSASAVGLPRPPMAGMLHNRRVSAACLSDADVIDRQRSLSGPGVFLHSPGEGMNNFPNRSILPPIAPVSPPVYSDYGQERGVPLRNSSYQYVHQNPCPEDYHPLPISHTISRRSFVESSASRMLPHPYNEREPRSMSPYHHNRSTSASHSSYSSPSPPVLTTPYHPSQQWDNAGVSLSGSMHNMNEGGIHTGVDRPSAGGMHGLVSYEGLTLNPIRCLPDATTEKV